MASSGCIYTFKGKEYSEKEFKSLLTESILGGDKSIDAVLEKAGGVSMSATPLKEKILESSDEFKKLVHKNIESDVVKNTLSNIERETGTELTKEEKEYNEIKLKDALSHGVDVVEKSKKEFGENYVSKLLDYLDENKSTLSADKKSLIQIAMELDLEKQIKYAPDNVLTLKKQLKLVRDKSIAEQRSAARAIGYGRLRQIARVGYDIAKVTDQFFSYKELKNKKNIESAIQANAETIQKQYEENLKNEEANIESKIKEGVEAEIAKLYEALPKVEKTRADKAIAALDKIHDKLRNKTYESTIGIPVAIIDAGVLTIRAAIKAGVKIADAIEMGIAKIKEKYGKEWAKEDEFRNDFINGFKDEGVNEKGAPKIVKDALIEQGFSRTITIKGEKKEILDWKKLAGAEGSIDKIKENVEKVLTKEGYSKTDILGMQTELLEAYNGLRASVIEKGLNEIANRNKETITPDQKSAAKKLAEMYNYGLFEQKIDEFDLLINKVIGSSLSEKGFLDAKKIANAMQTLYSSSFKGVKLSDVSAKALIQQLDNNLRILLAQERKRQGDTNIKIANIVRSFMDIKQTMILNNLGQALENPFSGFEQNVIENINKVVDKSGAGSMAMAAQRRSLMKTVYKDMVLNGGIGYGDVSNKFANRGSLDDYINKMSDSKLYHSVASIATGKATLDAMDAMFKSSITEKKFATNLIKILTNETNKNKMSKEEAIQFVSEKLTGQTLADARVTAKEVIDKINKDAKETLIPNNKEAIERFANDIVKSSLEMGGKISADEINAAYKAAYKAAGEGLGHEANNPLSESVNKITSKIEDNIEKANKEKDWRRATWLTYYSIFWRNVANHL